MLRAVRMASRFGFTIDPITAAAIQTMAEEIKVVSPERIADELRKLLTDHHRAWGMRSLMDLGLMATILPELLPMRGLPQGYPNSGQPPLPPLGHPGPGHVGDLWDHTLHVLEYLGDTVSFPLAWAALFHDVGKPRTVGRTSERYTFHGHEHVGKRLVEEASERLRLSNEERIRSAWLVEKHQILADAPRMQLSKLKALLCHAGIHDLFLLHRADAQASGRSCDHVAFAESRLREWTTADILNPPALLTGHDLMEMGLKPGPVFKKLLDAVREAQLEETIHTHQEAITLVQGLRNSEERVEG